MKKQRITIIVGCGVRGNMLPISTGARVGMLHRARTLLIETCGGFTFTRAEGGWRGPDGSITEEEAIVFTTMVDPGAVMPKALAEMLRDCFEQRAVVLTTETVDVEFI
jgi:hypothetical protein